MGLLTNNWGVLDYNYEEMASESKLNIVRRIIEDMKPYLNQKQITELNHALMINLEDVELIDKERPYDSDYKKENKRLYESFMDSKKLEGRSENTLHYYGSTLEKLLMSFDKPLQNVTTNDIREWLILYKETGVSNVTVNNVRRIFNSFFSWLEAEEYILRNPMRRIHRVKEEYQIKKPYSEWEIERLRVHLKDSIRDRAIFELLLSTGMRLSELVGLNRGDVDFSEREIIVFGKGAKQRIVYFDDRTNLFLQKYLETRDDDNPALFIHQKRRGDKYLRLDKSGLGTRVRMWGRDCGIEDVHPHRFRRTMATRALRAGMPIEQIQVILGHSSIETTRIYAKVNQDDVKYAHRKYVR